ncbi:NUDIX domain-containing protein [Candidatus Gracilibacteria bacterium]|nr:NUDIX domain-containing protein [Candidatus Gracilibacteria bacterium]
MQIMHLPPEIYKQVITNSIVSSVDVIFVNGEGKILLGLRNNEPLKGVYYIPGGMRYKGETIEEGVRRKMKEELGIDIDVGKLIFLGVYDDIFENGYFEGVKAHSCPITYVYHLSDDEEKNIGIGDIRHNDIKFFDIDDPTLHEMVKIRVRDMREKGIV